MHVDHPAQHARQHRPNSLTHPAVPTTTLRRHSARTRPPAIPSTGSAGDTVDPLTLLRGEMDLGPRRSGQRATASGDRDQVFGGCGDVTAALDRATRRGHRLLRRRGAAERPAAGAAKQPLERDPLKWSTRSICADEGAVRCRHRQSKLTGARRRGPSLGHRHHRERGVDGEGGRRWLRDVDTEWDPAARRSVRSASFAAPWPPSARRPTTPATARRP